MTDPTKAQDDLIAFVTDPATIKKAVEHSMEKRRQVMYPTKAEEMTLDDAIRKFKGYVNGENDFDELDFKEWLIDWREAYASTQRQEGRRGQ